MKKKLNQFSERIKVALDLALVQAWFEGFRLSPGWVRGPVIGVGLVLILLAGYYGVDAHTGYGLAADLLLPILLAVLGYALFLTIGGWFVPILLRLPPLLWVVIAVALIFGVEVWGQRTWLHWLFNLGTVAGVILLGTAIAGIRRDWETAIIRKKVMLGSFALLGTGILATIGGLVFSPGKEAAALPVEIPLGETQIAAPDPSQPGSYPVGYLTYGTGEDLHREEFGEEVGLVSRSVDASPYVTYSDWNAKLRKFFFGFSEDAFPLNGRVWYPEGQGPFPLVLIVHGNHNLADYSDPGYQYLGELLASRGYIIVSVDQNFLNGGIPGRSSGENDARAWMLLEHLVLWDEWTQDSSSPFYQQVDLGNIALIGHSRGGEAVALAATFNQLSRYPNNARTRWDYGFGIKAVVGIAPVDMQWMPADHPNPLVDVSYLVIQGSHDADLYYFDAIQQYHRTTFTDPEGTAFKSSVYIYRANHGQFNTTWGARDYSGIKGIFLNRKALLTADEQQQIAKVYISSFLEATLHGEQEYSPLFEDHRTAGVWLPQTGYITQYADYGTQLLADYEEDFDAVTASLPGASIKTGGLLTWREKSPRFRNGDRQLNHAAYLGWSSVQGYYTVKLPYDLDWDFNPQSVLLFKVADGRPGEEAEEGLDFSVALVDDLLQKAEISLSDILPLQTQFPAEIYRIPLWNEEYIEDASEPVFQGYRIPLQVFLEANPDLDLANLKEIRFIFDDQMDGKIFLDEIGFDLDIP